MRPTVDLPAVVSALAILLARAIVVSPFGSGAQVDDGDDASPGDWIYLAVLTSISVMIVGFAIIAWYRGTNPNTGLPHRAARRRRSRDER